jgi:hypothetical protein
VSVTTTLARPFGTAMNPVGLVDMGSSFQVHFSLSAMLINIVNVDLVNG